LLYDNIFHVNIDTLTLLVILSVQCINYATGIEIVFHVVLHMFSCIVWVWLVA